MAKSEGKCPECGGAIKNGKCTKCGYSMKNPRDKKGKKGGKK